MNSSSRTPPRFVPTLTEVVPASVEPGVLGEADALPSPSDASDPVPGLAEPVRPSLLHPSLQEGGLMTARGVSGIPRNLPPLPEALPPQPSLSGGRLGREEPDAAALLVSEPSSEVSAPAVPATAEPGALLPARDGQDAEAQLQQRVMQRVEQLLEQRLHEAISGLLQAQARSMAEQLREDVASVVRRSVRDAVAQELSRPPLEQ